MPSTSCPGNIGLLLAAGRGARFDVSGKRSKLLEPVTLYGQTKPCALWSLQALASCSSKLVCAVPSFASAGALSSAQGYAAQHLASLRELFAQKSALVIEVPFSHWGMGESLAYGVAHILHDLGKQSPAMSLTVHLADMPWVSGDEISALVSEHHQRASQESIISVPMVNGIRGNPIVFGRTHWPSLLACSGDQGARKLIKQCEAHGLVNPVTLTSNHAIRDLDEPI